MGVYESDNLSMVTVLPESLSGAGYAVTFSPGIRKIRFINRFLGISELVSPWQARTRRLPLSFVVVWGRKQNSQRALRYASANNLPVRYVEDGWIRSCSADGHSRLSYSLLIDNQGVYYDSSVPSALESYLNQPDDEFTKHCTQRELDYAQECRQTLVDNDITKYNFVVTSRPEEVHDGGQSLVLVLDQTLDDASVRFGGMDAESFDATLARAVDENPNSRIVVRTHPDVVTGRRQGYLQHAARQHGVELSALGDNPMPWLKAASVVYVGTSQLGYEALLCGCTVKVSGQPFYAGWGLTDDFQPIRRRIRVRTLDQLFHASHVKHAHYRCPVTGRDWMLHDCIAHVQLQQQYFSRNAGKRVAVGITPWKRKYLAQFLRSPKGSLRFADAGDVHADEVVLRWSFTDTTANNSATQVKTCVSDVGSDRCVRVEDGFIRSRGLGSDYAAPASLVFDQLGLYFDATSTSDLENLLVGYKCTEAELDRARSLRKSLLTENLTKYNVGTLARVATEVTVADSEFTRILVIGQVEGDQSLLRGAPEVSSNGELLEAVKAHNPKAHIVYRPHPDVVSGNRQGKVAPDVLARCADNIETTRHLLDCLEECDELHTMTSLSGFEALIRGKRVFTYGLPFYAGWGLTHDAIKCNRRNMLRSIDELVYLCLVVYPHYVDLDSGEFVSVEQLVEKLTTTHTVHRGFSRIRWVRKLSNIANSLTYSK